MGKTLGFLFVAVCLSCAGCGGEAKPTTPSVAASKTQTAEETFDDVLTEEDCGLSGNSGARGFVRGDHHESAQGDVREMRDSSARP